MGKPKGPSRTRIKREGLLPMTERTESLLRVDRRPLERDYAPLSAAQRFYDASIDANTLTFGVGPAGTGKTYVATAKPALGLLDRQWSKLIITRPAVEAGEELGFLPGELGEKFDPYFAPVRHILDRILGRGVVEALIRSERIVAMPLAYMRGHSFDDSFVILDEAQNTTPVQMKLFLTRVGENTKVVVNGDLSQVDIKGPSGLADALDRLEGMDNVAVCRFIREDIVRSGFVQQVVEAYENHPEDD
jgi:phosphate starvation-inducible protein PhoH and related proteins